MVFAARQEARALGRKKRESRRGEREQEREERDEQKIVREALLSDAAQATLPPRPIPHLQGNACHGSLVVIERARLLILKVLEDVDAGVLAGCDD